ncbi:AraC family transcriptional regulator [Amycolatopsis suaedae]|uniref:AraC family transcriptional regulator n=1 Tax=Amycolatopsis suaedae TaxID=2510978 RepID=A0A4Q7JA67_9PSEU|nr:AraC family transcriptional regulator [Amycolatopsis suaedae]RZQ63908.1 AraC family transcriptional regulator [Amycolatopsis suaedae]
MSAQTVPISFVHRLLRVAERRGFDVLPILRDAGIPADIAYRPKTRVTVEQMSEVTRELWTLTQDELFGLGPPMPLGTLKYVALSLVHAPDLREVGIRASGATKVTGVPRIRVEYGADTSRLTMDVSELDDPEHLGTELLLALAHRLMGWLIGKRIPLRALELPYPAPRHASDYDKIFGRMATFDAGRAAFAFGSALLESPVIRDECDLAAFLKDQPGVWYATRDYGSTTADQVRRIVEYGLRGQWPTPAEIAARMNVSVQHLRRLLRDQETSVSEIKEEILRDAAIASLVRGEESVNDLAARLGFSEASAFRRAFRRWTGSPPGAYRAGGA